jgi:hypothetical protein
MGVVARLLRKVAHELAETVRWGATRGAVAQATSNPRGTSGIPPSIAGAMAIGEGRRLGAEANEGSITDSAEGD